MPKYFTDFTWTKFALYATAGLYVSLSCFVAVFEPWMDLPCDSAEMQVEYPNPGYIYHGGERCRHARFWVLLGFTPAECAYARRLVASVFLGGLIGWERRQADRPAGIRTMSLVSLGSCLFTINSAFAFLNGPMDWDASRISAAIPSGVGFLGAGLIFKKEEKTQDGDSAHVVHGLTTAASVWLSAAVGIACGGDLFMPASFGVAIMLLLLRFGPRGHEDREEDTGNHHGDIEEMHLYTDAHMTTQSKRPSVDSTGKIDGPKLDESTEVSLGNVPDYESIHRGDEEMVSLTSSARLQGNAQKRAAARKQKAALGSML